MKERHVVTCFPFDALFQFFKKYRTSEKKLTLVNFRVKIIFDWRYLSAGNSLLLSISSNVIVSALVAVKNWRRRRFHYKQTSDS